MIRNFIFIIVFCSFSLLMKAQNIGIGADAMYNFQTESFGFGARVNFFPNSSLSIVPQVAYYPGFNKINEYYFGLSLKKKIIRGNTFNFYLLAHGAYNLWANHEESSLEGAQASNWNAEVGAGITTNRCLRPFLEYRYNFKFQETHLRSGLLYIFGCKGGSGNGYGGKNRGGKLCPAYH